MDLGWQGDIVQFDFNLVRSAPGWADPRVEVGGTSMEMRASYVTDALGDLLNSMMLLVNGSPVAECEWTQEPGGWRWTFIRHSETEVDVRIAFKPDVFEERWMAHDSGEVRTDSRLGLEEVVRAIAGGARRCLDEFGAPGFASQWLEHPFPRLQLEALERWLDAGEVAPLFERDRL